MKAFENHIDPEKEEQLRWVKIGKISNLEPIIFDVLNEI